MHVLTNKTQSHIPADFKISGWYVAWTLILLVLVVQVLASWLRCLAQRAFTDNLIPLLSALISIAAIKHYRKTAPAFLLRLDLGGLVFLCTMSVMVVSGECFQLSRLYWFGFLGMMVGLMWALAGKDYCKHWLPLFLFSCQVLAGAPLCCVNWLSIWLKMASLRAAIWLASFAIPITSKNDVFFVKGYPFQVTAACSGLALWEGLIFVILLWQMITPMRWRKVLALQLLAATLAVVMNGLRLAITALVAFRTSPQAAITIHSNLEYVLFPIALVILWVARKRMRP